jgi:hypothetical protein
MNNKTLCFIMLMIAAMCAGVQAHGTSTTVDRSWSRPNPIRHYNFNFNGGLKCPPGGDCTCETGVISKSCHACCPASCGTCGVSRRVCVALSPEQRKCIRTSITLLKTLTHTNLTSLSFLSFLFAFLHRALDAVIAARTAAAER